jgi:hypothetical protein
MMARGQLTYRERDLKTAIKVLHAAGYEVARVEFDSSTGKPIIVTARSGTPDPQSAGGNEWDNL